MATLFIPTDGGIYGSFSNWCLASEKTRPKILRCPIEATDQGLLGVTLSVQEKAPQSTRDHGIKTETSKRIRHRAGVWTAFVGIVGELSLGSSKVFEVQCSTPV